MKRFLILLGVILFAYDPSKVTKEDLEILKKFENLVYKITTKKEKINDFDLYRKITFCLEKKEKWIDRLKIYAKFEATAANKSESNLLGSVGIQYNIFDPQEAKKANQGYLQKKQNAISLVTKYLLQVQKIKQLEEELKYLKLKEIRLKARQKTGVINLDDRLKNLEKILNVRKELQNAKINLFDLIHKINTICPNVVLEKIQ